METYRLYSYIWGILPQIHQTRKLTNQHTNLHPVQPRNKTIGVFGAKCPKYTNIPYMFPSRTLHYALYNLYYTYYIIAPPPPHECAEWGGGARLPRRCGRAKTQMYLQHQLSEDTPSLVINLRDLPRELWRRLAHTQRFVLHHLLFEDEPRVGVRRAGRPVAARADGLACCSS